MHATQRYIGLKQLQRVTQSFEKEKNPQRVFSQKILTITLARQLEGHCGSVLLTYPPAWPTLGALGESRGQNIPEIGFKIFSRKYSPQG